MKVNFNFKMGSKNMLSKSTLFPKTKFFIKGESFGNKVCTMKVFSATSFDKKSIFYLFKGKHLLRKYSVFLIILIKNIILSFF